MATLKPAEVARISRRRSRLATAATALIALLLSSEAPHAASAASPTDPGQPADTVQVSREYELKAAFLRHFAYYTWWPKPSGPFIIATVGEEPFGDLLGIVSGLGTASGRQIEIRRFADSSSIDHADLLFVPRHATDEAASQALLDAALEATAHQPVLVVSDLPDGARLGACISFAFDPEANRIRMTINLAAARERGLGFRSKLLNLANVTLVGKGEPVD